MNDEYEYDRYLPSKITTFRQLLQHIEYSLDDNVNIVKHKDWRPDTELGVVYSINKLYIRPTSVEYKMEKFEMNPEIFEKFEQFVKLIEEV